MKFIGGPAYGREIRCDPRTAGADGDHINVPIMNGLYSPIANGYSDFERQIDGEGNARFVAAFYERNGDADYVFGGIYLWGERLDDPSDPEDWRRFMMPKAEFHP